MIPNWLKRLFKGRAKNPAPPVPPVPPATPPQEPPSEDDYKNTICRRIFNNPECGMMMANIDDDGNLHFSDGFIIPVDKIPRNDNRIY